MTEPGRQRRATPPRLAEALVAWVAPPALREDVLGDLHEQYLEHGHSRRAALAYWREALRTLPALAWYRLEHVDLAGLALASLTGVCAFVSLTYWDVSVARRLAAYVAALPHAPALPAIRLLYFLLLFLGASVVGALAASMSFRQRKPFLRNALTTLGPLVTLLAAAVAISSLSTSHVAPFAYLALRLAVIVAALVIGAYITARLKGVP